MFRNRFARLLLLSLAIPFMGCSETAPVADEATARTTPSGAVIGSVEEEGKVYAWRGIPFAQPPVDDLRWRAPLPADAWEGTRQALASGSECAQLGGEPVMGGEDCLYLDVFAPALETVPVGADRLPVMFWIHGGGNSIGAGNQLPPAALARDNNVIVVTINYRLGIFGWLAHPALRATAAGPEDASGNFGTLDMIRGLEWVQEHIASFGGNPDRVTIFGESAGGMNVFSLLVSPRAKGLFHAAISESGAPTAMTPDETENYTDDPEAPGLPGSSGEFLIALLERAGKATDRESAKAVAAEMTHAETESFLRGFTTEELLAPFAELMEGTGMPIYITPNIFQDGHVVSLGEPIELLGTPGAYNAVPFIAGTNREESKLFFAMNSPHLETTFGMPSGFSNERMYDLEGEYGGMIWRAMGADEPISAMRAVQGPSVWAYRFDWDEEPSVLGMDLSKLIGAGHAVEMLFVFGLTDLGFANRFIFDDPESAARLSAQMRSYWANFAHTFEPGRGQSGDLPEWPAWGTGKDAPKYIIFDSDRDGGIEFGRDRIDQAFVLSRAGKDPRVLNDEERCRLFRNFVQWSEAMTVPEYAATLGGLCQEWPLESRLFFPSLSHEMVN